MFGFIRNIWAGTMNKASKKSSSSTRRRRVGLAVEELTPRIVPSATPGIHFSHHNAVLPVSNHSQHSPSAFAVVHNSHNTATNTAAETGTELEANLTDPTGATSPTAKAEFNTASGQLEVHIRGAAASTSLDVVVNGNKVGGILTDANGNGKLELTQANLGIQVGSSITIGALQGTFAAGDSSEKESGTESTLGATLTDPTGATSATAKAEFNTASGELEVHIRGAAASTSLDVVVNGNKVGSIFTDANGNGKLELTQTNLGIQVGSTIAIGSLQGTFAAEDSSEKESGTESTLGATLTDPTGASSATAKAEFSTVSGELEVHIRGAAASTSLDVLVNSNKVGSILTDANGNGKLELTQANLGIVAGSTITIGPLQGTFAAQTGRHE